MYGLLPLTATVVITYALWLQGGRCLLGHLSGNEDDPGQAKALVLLPGGQAIPPPKWNRVNILMYGLLPPTATVVITYAHYGFKEVIVSAWTSFIK